MEEVAGKIAGVSPTGFGHAAARRPITALLMVRGGGIDCARTASAHRFGASLS